MRIAITTLFWLACLAAGAQENPWFQQEVNYRISVKLDDIRHELGGEASVEYINHSPDTLPFLYFHLWANAFSERTTDFANQQIRSGSAKFYFAKDSDLGGYESIDFLAEGETLSWRLEPGQPDIARVELPNGLAPGGTIVLNIPFQLKVPASFSRLGHVGESYQFTQWYPKPAVYDRDGWHPMPYLSMGEFYSEFGSFEVEITLPANYVVGATGILQTEAEHRFLEEKVAATRQWLEQNPPKPMEKEAVAKLDTFPPSAAEWKTISYKADKVHDFAWFADKRFFVMKGEQELASGRVIDTWVFFTHAEHWLWTDAISYLNRSIRFFSDWVGEYPWPQASAVMSALSAGGGMEYPMITVIGNSSNAKALDMVITHEVGHNWFYGILASNERDHPWMDEGITTYYEHRHAETWYGKQSLSELLPKFIAKGVDMQLGEIGYLFQARRHRDQAPDTHSDDFGMINYWLGAYEKPGMAFRHLEGYLGLEAFDRAMQTYYREWQFRHPGPAELREVLERETGKNLDWLFEGYIASKDKLDYALRSVKKSPEGYDVRVKNRRKMSPPFALYGLRDDEVTAVQWYEGFEGTQTLPFPAGEYDRFVIDKEHYLLDFKRSNNWTGRNGRFRTPRLGFLTGLEHMDKMSLYAVPLLGWNNYDKLQLGVGLHNYSPIQKAVEWHISPLYGFASKQVNGLAGIRTHLYPGISLAPEWTLSLDARRFSNAYNGKDEYFLDYYRLVPSLRIRLRAAPNGSLEHFLRYRAVWVSEQRALFDDGGEFSGKERGGNLIHIWSYELDNRNVINPHSLHLAMERQAFTDIFGSDQSYLRLSADARGKYAYEEGKHLYGRVFLGYHLANTMREAGFIGPGAFNLTAQGHRGHDDYRYDEFYFARNEAQGIFANQISMRDAGFKNAFSSAFQGQSGNTNDFMIAFNFKADLPRDLPLKIGLKPYFDIAYASDRQPISAGALFKDQLWWSGGVCVEVGDDILGIYFPIFNSENLRQLYRGDGRDGYWSQVSFQFDIRKLNPLSFLSAL